jgi:hypothetical protein
MNTEELLNQLLPLLQRKPNEIPEEYGLRRTHPTSPNSKELSWFQLMEQTRQALRQYQTQPKKDWTTDYHPSPSRTCSETTIWSKTDYSDLRSDTEFLSFFPYRSKRKRQRALKSSESNLRFNAPDPVHPQFL